MRISEIINEAPKEAKMQIGIFGHDVYAIRNKSDKLRRDFENTGPHTGTVRGLVLLYFN